MTVEIHPVANIFPMMQPDEFQELTDDIRQNGLREKIWLHPDGRIIDGRNRYKACLAAGVTPEFQTWSGNDSLVAFVVSLNLKRRHLTLLQKAAVGVDMLPLLEEEAKERQREAGGDRKSEEYQKSLVENFPQAIIPNKATAIPFAEFQKQVEMKKTQDQEENKSRQQAAKIVGTNERYISDMKRYKDEAPEIYTAAKEGKINGNQAKALSKVEPAKRKEYIEKVVTEDLSGKEIASIAKQEEKTAKREEKKAERQLVADSLTTVNAVSTPPRRIQPGEWWQLGEHRLFCGDTSSVVFQTRLPERAAFAFADPPYNANAADWDTDFLWRHDYLADVADVVAVTPGICAIFDFAKQSKMPYKWSMACWIKNGMTRGEMGFGNWIYAALFATGSLYRNAQDFCQVTIKTSETGDTAHKGRKPAEFIAYLFQVFTKETDIVIDPFLGSGTTLLTAETMKRTCIGGDISPEFCQQIIARWEALTGKTAEVCE